MRINCGNLNAALWTFALAFLANTTLGQATYTIGPYSSATNRSSSGASPSAESSRQSADLRLESRLFRELVVEHQERAAQAKSGDKPALVEWEMSLAKEFEVRSGVAEKSLAELDGRRSPEANNQADSGHDGSQNSLTSDEIMYLNAIDEDRKSVV